MAGSIGLEASAQFATCPSFSCDPPLIRAHASRRSHAELDAVNELYDGGLPELDVEDARSASDPSPKMTVLGPAGHVAS